jgi:hypothetical protein
LRLVQSLFCVLRSTVPTTVDFLGAWLRVSQQLAVTANRQPAAFDSLLRKGQNKCNKQVNTERRLEAMKVLRLDGTREGLQSSNAFKVRSIWRCRLPRARVVGYATTFAPILSFHFSFSRW